MVDILKSKYPIDSSSKNITIPTKTSNRTYRGIRNKEDKNLFMKDIIRKTVPKIVVNGTVQRITVLTNKLMTLTVPKK